MATTRTFADMLNEYLPNKLLKEEMIKRTWLLNNCEVDEKWKGGTLIVPFKGAAASSLSYGSLTASNDVSEDDYVRGQVSTQKELWGTMLFNHRDLMEHDKVSEQNFLRILPDSVDEFMDRMKNVVSTNLLNGSHFDELTADSDTNGTGVLDVRHPDRFEIGQKISIDDDDSPAVDRYVIAIDINNSRVTVSNSRGGSATATTAYSTAQNAKIYEPGAQSNAFDNLRDALLSNANGGSAALYGQTKTAYPYLQAINVDGSSITEANIMDEIFDALTTVRRLGKGRPTKVVMSYKNFGSCLKAIEISKGAFNVVPESRSASQYGWDEIEIGSVKGRLTLVGIQECDDDVIYILDMRAFKFYTHGMFRKRKSPDGNEFFEVRNTTGYQYLIDVSLYGEFVVLRPSTCGIIHTVSY